MTAIEASYAQTDVPRRPRETQTALSGLDQGLNALADAVAEVEDRLARVTRPSPPGEDLLSAVRETFESQHAANIASETDRLHSMTRRLVSVLDRLEI